MVTVTKMPDRCQYSGQHFEQGKVATGTIDTAWGRLPACPDCIEWHRKYVLEESK